MLLIKIWVDFEIIVGILLLIEGIILGIQNILEVLLEDLGILIMESIFLYTNITIIPHSVSYVSDGWVNYDVIVGIPFFIRR